MLCRVHDLGLMEYQPAWDLQNRLAAEIARGERPPTLLLLEHPHTFTFGRRGDAANLLWDEAQLQARGVAVHWVDRGGDVTYHGPGQLVGYPLIPLGVIGVRSLPTSDVQNQEILQSTNSPTSNSQSQETLHSNPVDYVGYVRNLEKMLIAALGRLGLESGPLNGKTGVWVQQAGSEKPAKIAAIGVKVDARGVTRHGFALNVNPDMSYFEGIVPCGISEYPVMGLADVFSPPPAMQTVKHEVTRAFGETLGYKIVIVDV